MSETRKGRPGEKATQSKMVPTTDTSVTPRVEIPHARTQAGPPCRGRGLWSAVVLRCPWCLTLHVHRSGQVSRLLSGRVVRRCPVSGQQYVLSPVQRRREAVRSHG